MRTNSLLALLAAALLSGAALGQSTSLTEIDAVRNIKNDPTARKDTNAFFAFGLTRDNGATFVTSASSDENAEIRGEIHPEPEHVGLTTDLFMVIRLEDNSWWMKDTGGNWQEWPRPIMVSKLVPFRTNVALDANIPVTFLSGMITDFSGELRLFLGYEDPTNGILQHNPNAHKVTISIQTAEEMAFELFESRVSPNIVQSVCIACHASGTGQPVPYVFERTSSTNHLETNFAVIKSLRSSLGKSFVLSKVSGGVVHSGGAVVQEGSQNYEDLEELLTLLE